MHGPRWPVGTAQRVPTSVSQDRGGQHPSSHHTRPYLAESRAPAAVAASRSGAGYPSVTRWRADWRSHLCREERAAPGGGKRRGAVPRKELVWSGSRVGPKWVSGRSWVCPKWVAG